MNISNLTKNIAFNALSESFRKNQYNSKIRPKLHFKSLVKLILECQRLNAEYSLRNKMNDEIMPFIQNLTFHFEISSPLLFDPSIYKADKQLKVPEEVRNILKKDISDRTNGEITVVEIYLKGISAVREYPVRMQREIAKYGFYEKYNCKRILVRQGHRASSFYIILSGSVFVIIMNNTKTIGGVVAYLDKGQSFGELAIIHKTQRQSTVVAKETVELLSISIKDFHEIFMSGGIKMIMDPDHDEFIKSSFLADFPQQLLIGNQQKFFFQYFRNNEILSRDTNNSKWIYLVKSGEISVIFLEHRKNKKEKTDNERNVNNSNQYDKIENIETITNNNVPNENGFQKHHIRTIAEDFDLAYDNVESNMEINSDCKWIQIQRIRKRDVFGLIQCFFPNQPKFILLSKGVEVFMLDKSFFLSNCTDKNRMILKNTLNSYPSIEQLHETIREQRRWNKFKQMTLSKTLSKLNSRK